MSIPESQLDTWSHQGSVTQSKNTYATVKRALEASDTKYANKSYSILLQGSYGNDTNIYAESDVDVVMKLESTFYSDISKLSDADKRRFDGELPDGTYSYKTFKEHVIEALEGRFGKPNVKPGNKAVKIKGDSGRRDADVLVCAQFRRYRSFTGSSADYEEGICFWNGAAQRIVNYPRQHSDNCTTKHQSTSSWFKPLVRIFKNMRSRLVDNRVLAAGTAPSYYIEGLLYNVPAAQFGSSYAASVVGALNWMHQADRSEFVCAHEQYYLLRDNFDVCWPIANGNAFIDAVTTMWNKW